MPRTFRFPTAYNTVMWPTQDSGAESSKTLSSQSWLPLDRAWYTAQSQSPEQSLPAIDALKPSEQLRVELADECGKGCNDRTGTPLEK